MSGIAQVLAQFGHAGANRQVISSLEADVPALRGIWKSHIKQGLMTFDVATIERVDALTALKSLGIALAIEHPDVDVILNYIDSDKSGFRDPSRDNALDDRMLAAVNSGFREARTYGFKSLNNKPPFEMTEKDLAKHDGDYLQHVLSEYETHINRHLPVPRLYTQKSFGNCQVRSPRLYDAIFDSTICMTHQQLTDLSYAMDYDALEKLASFKDTPDSIRSIIHGQMQSFDYLTSLDARKKLLGNGEMTMTESKVRLESAFRYLGNHGGSSDVAPTIKGIKAFEFSSSFTQSGLQHTVDNILLEYGQKPVSLSDPAAPEVYREVFSALAGQGLEIDTTAIMAKERVDFCRAKDMKEQGGGLLPKILKGLGAPSNNLVKGALMAAVQTYPLPEVLKLCDQENDRQMKALYQVTGRTEFVGKMSEAGRDNIFAIDMGL